MEGIIVIIASVSLPAGESYINAYLRQYHLFLNQQNTFVVAVERMKIFLSSNKYIPHKVIYYMWPCGCNITRGGPHEDCCWYE